ncbi:MAG: hypothetical protein MUF70_14740 [Myxococcota bacterium]|jgi:hypothetical protein|nr:hypothetical protein [Myxococcota bacterium]
MQPTISTTSRRTLTIVRRHVRRSVAHHGAPPRAGEASAQAREASPSTDFRASLGEAFQALGASVLATTAQAKTNAFYHASRQVWARSLGTATQDFRRTLAAAFGALGASVAEDAAHERTVAYYRASGHTWAANLG